MGKAGALAVFVLTTSLEAVETSGAWVLWE